MSKEIKIPKLETPRLILRAIELSDAEDLFTYAKNEEIIKYVFWDAHKSINDSILFIKLIKKQYQNKNQIMWAIELKENKKMIGTCGFIDYFDTNKSIKIGYILNPEYWKKGYIKEALQKIIDYAFNKLDIIRIEGICVVENIASAKTMISCNMKFEGILHDNFIKNKKIYNCKLFAITKRNYLKNKKTS